MTGQGISINEGKKGEIQVSADRRLTRQEFLGLAEVPAEREWFANIRNPNTRRAYQNDLSEFMRFTGIAEPQEFRIVTRAHVIAWRDDLEKRALAGTTVRRKLAALSSLFDYLCEQNAVELNPVQGIKRPRVQGSEGKTQALSDAQAALLLNAPDVNTLKGKRDRAILGVLLYHAPRRSELCKLRVRDYHQDGGILHLRIDGKGEKERAIVVNPKVIRWIEAYLEEAGHRENLKGPLFRPVKKLSKADDLNRHLHSNSIYKSIVLHYAKETGVYFAGCRPHGLRATAATNALKNGADLARVKKWLGHTEVSTTLVYDKRQSQPEDDPTYKVEY